MTTLTRARRAPVRTLVDAQTFRHAVGHFATGVAVVTAMAAQGTPHGLTISSFASLSLDPPLVMFALRRASGLHDTFTTAQGFAVNVLAANQQDILKRFAGAGDRFAGISFEQGFDAAPLLPGVVAWLECELHSVQPGGDHSIIIGAVRSARTFPGAPLLYWRGAAFPDSGVV